MVDFRKMLLLLVVVFATIASAQVIAPLSCVANGGVPPLLRQEGVAEEVGQVVINCTGGTPTPVGAPIPTINVQIFLNLNITSRLVAGGSEAMLLIDEPAPANQVFAAYNYAALTPVPAYLPMLGTGDGKYNGGVISGRPNVFQAGQSGSGSVTWLSIPLDPPGSNPANNRTLRIVNVRANANSGGISGTIVPTAVNMFISISGTGSLALANPQITVGMIQPGLTFTSGSGTYNQCESGTKTFMIKFAERFGTAFRHKQSAGDQNVPGTVYNTESMFYGPVLPAGAGVATQGTQLIAKFSNVPANITIKVPLTATPGALLVSAADATVFQSSGGDTATLVSTAAGSTTDTAGVVAITGGYGAAVWEITTGIPGRIGYVAFDVQVSYLANPLPGLGTATVAGNYSPTTTVFTASSTEPVPRFVDSAAASAPTFTINACQTNLLFPFVTNQAGFDTGLVISNTSSDPFGTVPQRGPCTLYFYGNTTGGGVAPGTQVSATVNEGTQLIMTASGGGNLGLTAIPGFQGYIIARCSFQFAHGYAFVSDLGATRVAEGYLALVMDQNMYNSSSTTTRTKAKSEPLSN